MESKIKNLCGIKCDTLLESQNRLDLESDIDDDDNNDDDDDSNKNDKNHKSCKYQV